MGYRLLISDVHCGVICMRTLKKIKRWRVWVKYYESNVPASWIMHGDSPGAVLQKLVDNGHCFNRDVRYKVKIAPDTAP